MALQQEKLAEVLVKFEGSQWKKVGFKYQWIKWTYCCIKTFSVHFKGHEGSPRAVGMAGRPDGNGVLHY